LLNNICSGISLLLLLRDGWDVWLLLWFPSWLSWLRLCWLSWWRLGIRVTWLSALLALLLLLVRHLRVTWEGLWQEHPFRLLKFRENVRTFAGLRSLPFLWCIQG
jgi:hypothetical protein